MVFGSIGGPELVVILVVALLIFGPRKLPQIGRALGKGLAELRRASTDLKTTLDREIRLEEESRQPPLSRHSPQAEERGTAMSDRATDEEDPVARQPDSTTGPRPTRE